MYPTNASIECIQFLEKIEKILENSSQFLINHRALKKAVESVTGISIVVEWKDISAQGYVYYCPCEDENFPKGNFLIQLRNGMSTSEQLFTFCHEIGHILEGWIITPQPINGSYTERKYKRSFKPYAVYNRYNNKEERICDEIATRLLLPEEKLDIFIQKRWIYQLRLFEVFYPEKYWFFEIAETFKIPPKELAIYLKERFKGKTLKECIQKLKTSV